MKVEKKSELIGRGGASIVALWVGPGPTLAWPGWKQPDIAVEVDTGRLETDVGRQEF